MNRRLVSVFCALLIVWQAPTASAESGAALQESPAERNQRMAWFNQARFGMFIHWGLYALPAGEWNGKKIQGIGEWIMNSAQIPVADYEKFAPEFNPIKFDAQQWVRAAKEAGVKYIVITSKHHDGFSMFDSKVSDYTIVKSTPFKRDPLKELANACKKAGITFCFYHSIMDWHHPDAQRHGFPDYNKATPNPNFPRYVENYLKPQVKELLTQYGKIGIMWFDGEWIDDWKASMGQDLYNWCRTYQPGVIVNNRVGKARSGMGGMDKGAGAVGDYGTPEQEIPPTGFGPGVDWESCMTMNDTWGFKREDHNWKSAESVIRMLIDCASKGGNLLLNVGPTAEGQIPQASLDRLAEVGRWMRINHEAIYGTSASPFKSLVFGKCTQKPGKLYLHVFSWPTDGQLMVPIANKVKKARLLAAPHASLKTTVFPEGVRIGLPTQAPDPMATVILLEIQGAPEVRETRAGAK